MRSLFTTFILFITAGVIAAAANDTFSWVTRPEKSQYHQTSSYEEVMEWVETAASLSPNITQLKLMDSHEGRPIPLLIIGQEGIYDPASMRARGQSCILVMANIHAGEVEGKEACLMAIRDMVKSMPVHWIKNQVILMLPIINPDGNDKLSADNRGDNGPDEAGTRYNGQFLDLNRDYIKLDSPEINALITLFRQWDPILFLDMHTTNGSYHQHPVTYATASNPNNDPDLMAYMWNNFFPKVGKAMKEKFGQVAIPYGNFEDWQNPGQGGWVNDTFEARYGTNYYGLRNRFTILDENYSHADFKTRIEGAYALLRTTLDYCADNLPEMTRLALQADLRAMNTQESFTYTFTVGKLFDFTLSSYLFTKEKIKPEDRDKYPPWIKDFIVKKTDEPKEYHVSYMARAIAAKSRPLPKAYVILPNRREALQRLKAHGIHFLVTKETLKIQAEEFKMSKVTVAERLYQGLTPITVEGQYVNQKEFILPKGSIYIPINQRLRRLIPILLEPDQPDSLVSWGFFNRELVEQWSGRPLAIPVLRVIDHPPIKMEGAIQ